MNALVPADIKLEKLSHYFYNQLIIHKN